MNTDTSSVCKSHALIHLDMNEHLYIVQSEDIVEAINVMITRKKNP